MAADGGKITVETVTTHMSALLHGPIIDVDGSPSVAPDGEPLTWEGWFAAMAVGRFLWMGARSAFERMLVHKVEQAETDMLLFGNAYFTADGERIDPQDVG